MKQHDETELLRLLPQPIEPLVVRIKLLRRRVKLQPLQPEILDAVAQPLDLGWLLDLALLDGQERAATVTTQLPSRLLVLDRAAFQSLVRGFPTVTEKILCILAQRLRAVEHDGRRELGESAAGQVDLQAVDRAGCTRS